MHLVTPATKPTKIHPFDLADLLNSPDVIQVHTLRGTESKQRFVVNGVLYEQTATVPPSPGAKARYGTVG